MSEPTKRWDAEGRDVTDLPGLWGEEDRVPYSDWERLTEELDSLKEAATRNSVISKVMQNMADKHAKQQAEIERLKSLTARLLNDITPDELIEEVLDAMDAEPMSDEKAQRIMAKVRGRLDGDP